jgi:hypothetical protein
MADLRFKIWRILEEQESPNGKHRVVTKKEFVGEIENPKQEIYVTWNELAELFGEGYYFVEIPVEFRRRYLVPDKQYIRTPMYFEPSSFVQTRGIGVIYAYAKTDKRGTAAQGAH